MCPLVIGKPNVTIRGYAGQGLKYSNLSKLESDINFDGKLYNITCYNIKWTYNRYP